MSHQSCCVPSCTVTHKDGIALHRFPNPEDPMQIERFRIWVMNIGGDIIGKDNLFIRRNRRVCHNHFEEKYTFPNKRLTQLAVPTLHLPGIAPRRIVPMIVDEPEAHRSTTAPAAHSSRVVTQIDEPNGTLTAASSTSIISGNKTTSLKCGGISSTIIVPMIDEPEAHSSRSAAAAHSSRIVSQCDESNKTLTAVCSTSVFSGSKIISIKCVSRSNSKPMTKTEMELRSIIKATKSKLRKCQKSKESYRSRLAVARRVTTSSTFKKLSSKMTPAARIFFKMQVMQFGKKPQGRRFTTEEKILALSLYKPSPKAYKLLSQICILPKCRTLDKMLQKAQVLPGINDLIFHHLLKRVNKMPNHHRYCTIIFDEMAIGTNMSFDIKNDIIHGFIDNGEERTPEFCDHVLVFMIRGILKKYKQPVAFTFCKGSTKTIDLSKQIEGVIRKVMATGLKVIATVCDQGTSNVAALNHLMNITKGNYLRNNKNYDGGFFEINNAKIFPVYDPPHLIKGVRNNLLTKNLEYMIDGKIQTAKWSHLEALYQRGPSYKGVRLVHKLTAQHVVPNLIPKMRVKHCTQVFSQNVGTAMGYMAGIGKLPLECTETADILLFFDDLFDSVNGSFSKRVDAKGKVVNTNVLKFAVTPHSPHHKLWYKSLPVLKSMKFVTKRGIKCVVPTITSWIKTIEAYQKITKYLQSQGLNSILLRNFNQSDPLENFFGSIRAHGLRNIMPSASAFISSYKALLISNLNSPHSVGANCEDDGNTCLQSLKFFLTDNVASLPQHDVTTINEEHLSISLIDTDDLIKSQAPTEKEKCAAIAYCSGWLIQIIKKKLYKNCQICKNDFETDNMEEFHSFIKCKEYCKEKTWLCYPTRNMFDYFCQVENIVTVILQSCSHYERVSEYIMLIVSMHIELNFLKCHEHKENVTNFILKKTTIFFINSWCKEINNILHGKTTFWDESDVIKQAAHNYYIKHKKKP